MSRLQESIAGGLRTNREEQSMGAVFFLLFVIPLGTLLGVWLLSASSDNHKVPAFQETHDTSFDGRPEWKTGLRVAPVVPVAPPEPQEP